MFRQFFGNQYPQIDQPRTRKEKALAPASSFRRTVIF